MIQTFQCGWYLINQLLVVVPTQHIGVVNIPISSVIMLNGILCVGFSSSGGWGVSEIGFVSDSQRWTWTAGIYKQAANTIVKEMLVVHIVQLILHQQFTVN